METTTLVLDMAVPGGEITKGYRIMKIAGKHFFAYKPIAYYDSSIGRLAIYAISFGHNQKLLEAIGGNLASCDPMHFVKNLLLYICYPADALGEEQAKPDEIALSSDDIEKLTDDEINKIAELYVEHEPYLYRKQISETKTSEDGKQVTSFRYGDVEHPKKDGESNVHYLHRLYVIHEKKQREEMARFTKSIMGTAHFSSQAFKSIADTLSMGNSVAKAVEAMRFPGINDSVARAIESMKRPLMGDSMSKLAESMNKLRPSQSVLDSINAGIPQEARPAVIEPIHTKIDFEGLAESAAKAKWAPFKFLGERLDDLIRISSDSATFMVEMNKTQTAIASELKESGEQASRRSKWNLGLTIVVVVLTIVGLSFAWMNRSQGNQDAQALRQYADGIRSDLKSVADGLSSNRKSADDMLNAFLDQLRQERADVNTHLDKVLAEHLKNVERLKQEQAADRQTIEQLRARILELENQLKSTRPNTTLTGDK